jgi:Kef-type K+ transport system membrane component KefB
MAPRAGEQMAPPQLVAPAAVARSKSAQEQKQVVSLDDLIDDTPFPFEQADRHGIARLEGERARLRSELDFLQKACLALEEERQPRIQQMNDARERSKTSSEQRHEEDLEDLPNRQISNSDMSVGSADDVLDWAKRQVQSIDKHAHDATERRPSITSDTENAKQRRPSKDSTGAEEEHARRVTSMTNDTENTKESQFTYGSESSNDATSGKSRILKYSCLFVGFAGVLFVLVAKGEGLWDKTGGHSSSGSSAGMSSASHGNHRLLADSALPPGVLIELVSFCLAAAGIMAFSVNLLGQPLILGYLLAGVLVGPKCGLGIVQEVSAIQDFSSLGLIFLLFMVGLELNIVELFKMGKVVLVTGPMQLPVCFALHFGIFLGLNAMGLDFGASDKSVFYVALCCSISSTMIVAKILSEMADMGSPSGRLTIGILIFQDIWAIIILVIQPDLDDPQPTKLVVTFGKIIILIVVTSFYAVFVMPQAFRLVSKNARAMLVMSCWWTFFIGAFAILPFIGQSLELASLIAGVTLATFPYVAEFNGKVKYLRDFFITIYFTGLGMQIPPPEPMPIITAFIIAAVVLACRWIGIFGLVRLLGGSKRLAGVATLNLSEVSEFALVIVSLGMQQDPPHVEGDTLTIMIWVFSILGIMSANMLPHNHHIYNVLARRCRTCCRKCRRRRQESPGKDGDNSDDNGDEEGHHNRHILFLGFHKVAAMLFYQLHHHQPHVMHHIHVVDHHEKILPKIRQKGATASYGDIASADVLEHAVHGEVRMVVCTVPDGLLPAQHTNSDILRVALDLWPDSKVIVTADNPRSTAALYSQGAFEVLRVSELCADRIEDILHHMLEDAGGMTHKVGGLGDGGNHEHPEKHSFEDTKIRERRVSINHMTF